MRSSITRARAVLFKETRLVSACRLVFRRQASVSHASSIAERRDRANDRNEQGEAALAYAGDQTCKSNEGFENVGSWAGSRSGILTLLAASHILSQ